MQELFSVADFLAVVDGNRAFDRALEPENAATLFETSAGALTYVKFL